MPKGSKNYPDGLSDNSHLQEEGAVRIAALFLKGMHACSRDEEGVENMETVDCAELLIREDGALC